jgi:hypothetical protein
LPTLVTTIGATNANSYATVEEANAYFDDRLNSQSWTQAIADDKLRALIMAAARLNEENWRGERVNTNQALAWPRYDVEKKDAIHYGSFGYGYTHGYYEAYLHTEIPLPVKRAQMELALAYLEGVDEEQPDQIDSFSMDGLSVSRRISRPQAAMPAPVSRLLSGLIQGTRLVRA